VARRRVSLYAEAALIERLHAYARALEQDGLPVALAGLLEAALWEYLEVRCDRQGTPAIGVGPDPVAHYGGPGRPSAHLKAEQFAPRLLRRTGRPRGTHSGVATRGAT